MIKLIKTRQLRYKISLFLRRIIFPSSLDLTSNLMLKSRNKPTIIETLKIKIEVTARLRGSILSKYLILKPGINNKTAKNKPLNNLSLFSELFHEE